MFIKNKALIVILGLLLISGFFIASDQIDALDVTYHGDGTYAFSAGQTVQLDSGLVIKPVAFYSGSSDQDSFWNIKFDVYDKNLNFLGTVPTAPSISTHVGQGLQTYSIAQYTFHAQYNSHGQTDSLTFESDTSSVNLALNKPVRNFLREDYTGTDKWTASDEAYYQDSALASDRNYTPDKLTDGGEVTLSSLAYGANWKYGFEIDLGTPQPIKQLRLTWGHFGFGGIPVSGDSADRNGNFYMKDYYIFALVDGQWVDVAGSTAAPDERVTTITLQNAITASKLRITSGVDVLGNATKPAANWIGIYELEAYGSATSESGSADLVPTDITYDSSKLTDGTVVFFDSGIRNKGGATTGVFNIKWYVDGVQTGYGSHLGVPANANEPNGNSQYSWIARKGMHTIKFVVDADNHIAEGNETNNSVSITVNVTGNEPGGDLFSWHGYQWKPIYVVYGNDPSNGYGKWYTQDSNLYQDQVSALHYKVVATSMESLSNYEVEAVLNLRSGSEIALCGRMDDSGNGYCFVTHWGGTNSTMIAFLSGNEQNPGNITSGKSFEVKPGTDYVMKLRFEGKIIKGKIYQQGETEPDSWTAQATDGRFTTGKIAFYTYGSRPEIKSIILRDIVLSEPSPTIPSQTEPTQPVASDEQALRDRIKNLEYHISELENQIVALEKRLVSVIDRVLTQRVAGTILLQVEGNGEAWYVDPITQKKFYLKDGNSAYLALNAFGLGISNANLAQIPVGIEARAEMVDADGDDLDDKLEASLGTSSTNPDTDDDGFSDGDEVKNGYDPLGSGQLGINTALANQLKGRILLQVESHGEAWYVNPTDGKRYYMKDGALAYQIMRFLSLGITNEDLRKIEVGSFQ